VAAGHSSAPVKINLVAITSNVLGNLLMIPILGFTGAAWATMLMVCATLPVNQWYLRRKGYHVHGWDYLTPLTFLLVIGLLALLPALAAWWTRALLMVAYPVVCLVLSPALRGDLLRAWEQLGDTMRTRFTRQPSS
jgi:O-antigen/teichoic acid export membrane protein